MVILIVMMEVMMTMMVTMVMVVVMMVMVVVMMVMGVAITYKHVYGDIDTYAYTHIPRHRHRIPTHRCS